MSHDRLSPPAWPTRPVTPNHLQNARPIGAGIKRGSVTLPFWSAAASFLALAVLSLDAPVFAHPSFKYLNDGCVVENQFSIFDDHEDVVRYMKRNYPHIDIFDMNVGESHYVFHRLSEDTWYFSFSPMYCHFHRYAGYSGGLTTPPPRLVNSISSQTLHVETCVPEDRRT